MNVVAIESYSNEKRNICNVLDNGELNIERLSGENNYGISLTGIKNFLKVAFLPQGYPDSVSEDYLQYQVWDTLQAFCSSITGTLATQAMLKAYGVGDKTATAAGATITWMLKDGAGMVGRIFFAWLKGSQLDCDAKRWRFVADILNDFAILLDLIAPIFKIYFIYIACISSIARSIVGVAGGATRAALTLHQARRDNMADVSAKDGSQETLVNLMALVAGFIITPLVADNQQLVWILFFIFTYLHLFANYRAVSSVIMETVNLPRLHILLKHYLQYQTILTPKLVAALDPVLRKPGYNFHIKVGVQLENILKRKTNIQQYLSSFSKSSFYVIDMNWTSSSINIATHKDATSYDKRKSCFHALLLDMIISQPALLDVIAQMHQDSDVQTADLENASQLLHSTTNLVDRIFPKFDKQLESNGWDLNRCHLGLDEWRYELNKKIV